MLGVLLQKATKARKTQTKMVSPPCPGTRPAFFRVRSGLGWDLASSCKVSAKPKNGPTRKKSGWGGAAQPPPLRIQIRMLVEKACRDTQANVGGGDAGGVTAKSNKSEKNTNKDGLTPFCEPLVEVQEPPGRNKQRWIRGRRGRSWNTAGIL